MIEVVKIEFRDIEYMDYNEDIFYIIKREDFEEKYKKLIELSKNYDSFEEICDFINNNFILLDINEFIIKI